MCAKGLSLCNDIKLKKERKTGHTELGQFCYQFCYNSILPPITGSSSTRRTPILKSRRYSNKKYSYQKFQTYKKKPYYRKFNNSKSYNPSKGNPSTSKKTTC